MLLNILFIFRNKKKKEQDIKYTYFNIQPYFLSIENIELGSQREKKKERDIKYTHFNIQPYFLSIENIDLGTQRELFALRTQINHIPANFCFFVTN